VMDVDPWAGKMREPLLKLMHFLRSMEYKGKTEKGLELQNVFDQIGMNYMESPTVFNFYKPEYQPEGLVQEAGLFAPEAEIATAPSMIGFLNGMTSLIRYGLVSCHYGFGNPRTADAYNWRNCRETPYDLLCASTTCQTYQSKLETVHDGKLSFALTSGEDTGEKVAETLDLLLMAGRASARTKRVVAKAYDEAKAVSTPEAALQEAQRLVVTTSEFHSTARSHLEDTPRPASADIPSQGRRFKAIVVIYLNGGLDSFNLVVPHSNCTIRDPATYSPEFQAFCTATCSGICDLQCEYQYVRGGRMYDPAYCATEEECTGAALHRGDLDKMTIDAGGTQLCETFATHPSLPTIRQLYEDGDGAFIANMGGLVTPLTRALYSERPDLHPPGLFGHNTMTRAAQNLHAQSTVAKGILGRIVDGVTRQATPYRSAVYSIHGNPIMVSGDTNADILDAKSGVMQFTDYAAIADDIDDLLPGNVSVSAVGDTYTKLMKGALRRTEVLGSVLGQATLNEDWDTGSTGIKQQFMQVAKLIDIRENAALDYERAVYYVNIGGFDSHNNVRETVQTKFEQIDDAIKTFAAELKGKGVWDDTVIVSHSEFARTLTSNGLGTDHAWGGHHFILGGALAGRKIHGEYPESLELNSELNLGRGRVLPTRPFEAIWKPVAEWFGVTPSAHCEDTACRTMCTSADATLRSTCEGRGFSCEMESVLPNMCNFDEPTKKRLFTTNSVFKS